MTDTGTLTIAGRATFDLGTSQDMTLDNAANTFGELAITSSRDVTITTGSALALFTSTISGNLNLVTNGDITQSGALAITGNATFDANTNDITLDKTGNDFSTLSVTSGQDVSIQDSNSIALSNFTVSGNLNLLTNGNISQVSSSSLNITGNATFDANTSNITLNKTGNDFSTLSVTSGQDVSIQDSNSIALSNFTVSGNLNLLTNGNISQVSSSALAITGNATFDANTSNITLNQTGNDFSTLSVTSGQDVSIQDSNSIALSDFTVSGSLNLLTNGNISQVSSTSLNISGNATFDANTSNITLDQAGNDFASILITAGNNATLRDINALNLSGATISGNLTVATGNTLTATGAILAPNGLVTLTADNGINLDNASNQIANLNLSNTTS